MLVYLNARSVLGWSITTPHEVAYLFHGRCKIDTWHCSNGGALKVRDQMKTKYPRWKLDS